MMYCPANLFNSSVVFALIRQRVVLCGEKRLAFCRYYDTIVLLYDMISGGAYGVSRVGKDRNVRFRGWTWV